MNVSVILGHPIKGSLNNAIAETVVTTLKDNGHQVRYHDLYEERFDPVLPASEIPKNADLHPLIKGFTLNRCPTATFFFKVLVGATICTVNLEFYLSVYPITQLCVANAGGPFPFCIIWNAKRSLTGKTQHFQT